MNPARISATARRPLAVLVALAVLAIIGFWLVNRLVHRFGEEQKALARHLYARAQSEVGANQSEQGIQYLRAALSYDRDNFSYQLALARALRDAGHTDEAESYLVGLWERTPQDGAINLALARLYVRENDGERTIQYYHHAMYGVWPSEADVHRREVRLELVRYLLQKKMLAQAQSELIAMAAALPSDTALRLAVADLFAGAQDYEHALAQAEAVLRSDRNNVQALTDAGQAAFQLRRYSTAARYLAAAVRLNSQDAAANQNLALARLILQSDPFSRGIQGAERMRRVRQNFLRGGERLDACLSAHPELGAALSPFESHWKDLKPLLNRGAGQQVQDQAMDLVFQIEERTASVCGTPSGPDRALLLMAQAHAGAE